MKPWLCAAGVQLRDQIDTWYPDRRSTSDGWIGDATTTDGIKNIILNGKKTTVADVAAGDNPKEVARFSMAMIMKRIDRAKAKFAIAPNPPCGCVAIYYLAIFTEPPRAK